MSDYMPKSAKAKAPGYMPKSAKPKAMPAAKDTPSAQRAGIIGFAQGGLADFGDELAGAVGDLFIGDQNIKLGPGAQISPDDSPEVRASKQQLLDSVAKAPSTYETVRDLARAEDKAAQEAHPGTYGGSKVTGGVASALVPGALIGKAAKLGSGAKALMASGAAQGALSGLGESEAENFSWQQAKDTGVGGAFGTAGGAFGAGLGKATKGIGKYLKGAAERRAIKAIGGAKTDVKALMHKDGSVQELGRYVLDEKLLGPMGWGGVEGVAKRASAKAAKSGEEIGQALQQLDEIAPTAIKHRQIADAVENQVIKPKADVLGLEDVADKAKGLTSRMRDMRAGLGADEIGAERAGMSFSEAERRLKRGLDSRLKWDKEQAAPQEAVKEVRTAIKSAIEDKAKEVSPEVYEKWMAAKRSFGKAKDVERIADSAMNGEIGNRMVSPTDYGAGILGAAAGGPMGALTAGATNHAARKYLPAVLAQTGDSLGDAMVRGNTDELLRALGISTATRSFDRFRDLVRK